MRVLVQGALVADNGAHYHRAMDLMPALPQLALAEESLPHLAPSPELAISLLAPLGSLQEPASLDNPEAARVWKAAVPMLKERPFVQEACLEKSAVAALRALLTMPGHRPPRVEASTEAHGVPAVPLVTREVELPLRILSDSAK